MPVTAKSTFTIAAAVALSCGLATTADASSSLRHMPRHAYHAAHARDGVSYQHSARRGGYRALVSDGPGSGFGFHHLPTHYRVAAAVQQARQHAAVKSAVLDDAVDSQAYGYGFLGDSVYGQGTNAAYGVFNGADGYGSPYFAGFYGPATGKDYGVFGRAYD